MDPFAYDAYLEQKKNEKLEKERASRITVSYFHIVFSDFSSTVPAHTLLTIFDLGG